LSGANENMTSFLTRTRTCLFAAAMLALLSTAITAQERTARFQRTVDFAAPKTVSLNAALGPVKVSTIEFTDLGRGYSAGGFASRMRASSASEVSTALRAALTVDNPTRDEWELTLTLEFLDKDGKIVDKLTKKNDYDNETATWNIEHPLLEYVMPLIAEVRITIQGRIT